MSALTPSEWRAREARDEAVRASDRWEAAHEAAQSDVENLRDYVERLNQPAFYDFDKTMNDARGFLTALGLSLDALERLAR